MRHEPKHHEGHTYVPQTADSHDYSCCRATGVWECKGGVRVSGSITAREVDTSNRRVQGLMDMDENDNSLFVIAHDVDTLCTVVERDTLRRPRRPINPRSALQDVTVKNYCDVTGYRCTIPFSFLN